MAEQAAEATQPRGPLIDEWLPAYEVRDVATTSVRGSPEVAFATARELDFFDDSVIRGLFSVRQTPGRVLDWYRGVKRESEERSPFSLDTLAGDDSGFILLAEDDGARSGQREIVLGAVGRFWRPRAVFRDVPAEEFRSYAVSGDARAVIGLRAEPAEEGRSRVVFEIRVAPIGRGARFAFRAYWLGVGKLSHTVRKRALRRLKQELED